MLRIDILCSCVTVLFLFNLILQVTYGLNVPSANSRTCVIGAGFAGLAAARYLKEYGVNYTVFEATRHVGGTWRFDPHIGTDEDGLPLFTSMYKNLRTNTPRQTMEYHGFPFPETTPSYPTATCYYKYLKLFAKEFDIIKYVQFQTLITLVKWSGDHWDVTYMRTDSRTNQTEACDYMIIATGEYSNPVSPKFAGQDYFRGNIIHSHDYKEPERFRNRRVLVVGAGPSGLDMLIHLTNVTSKFVHSHHLVYNQQNYGEKYVKKPDIKEFTSNGVVFQDNSFEEIDDVILCTGYDYNHYFLDKNTGVTKSNKYVLPLYQHVVNIRHPTMAFVGISKKIINKVLDAQANYVAALIANKFQLPSQEQMLKIWLDHVYSLRAKGLKIVDVNVIGDKMDQYFANITQEAGVPRVPPVISEIRDFNAKYRLEDLLNYRDYDYKVLDDYKFEKWYNPREGSKELCIPMDPEAMRLVVDPCASKGAVAKLIPTNMLYFVSLTYVTFHFGCFQH